MFKFPLLCLFHPLYLKDCIKFRYLPGIFFFEKVYKIRLLVHVNSVLFINWMIKRLSQLFVWMVVSKTNQCTNIASLVPEVFKTYTSLSETEILSPNILRFICLNVLYRKFGIWRRCLYQEMIDDDYLITVTSVFVLL